MKGAKNLTPLVLLIFLLPVAVRAQTASESFAGLVGERDGIGQVTVAVKWRVLEQPAEARLGLAVRPQLDVPIRKGIDCLLTHPVGTADLQYGFDGILSRSFGNAAEFYLNAVTGISTSRYMSASSSLPMKHRWASAGIFREPAVFNLSAKRQLKFLSAAHGKYDLRGGRSRGSDGRPSF